ncbi:NlpC/P60 domain-containing protein [Bordetella tumbae]
MINRYLLTRYVAGGRGPHEYDCWGMARDARAELFNKPLLPSCPAAKPGALQEITLACGEVAGAYGLRPTPRVPGAIATAWRAGLCVHVGLVVEADNMQWILETDIGTGPCLTRPSKFEERYTKVVYYAD